MFNDSEFEAILQELEGTSEQFWNVSRDNATFLAMLVQTAGCHRVLEVGTSNGYSTLWLARALLETGGEVTAIEFDAGRAAAARCNFERAGLTNITLLEGDARELIVRQAAPFDLVFLDAEKSEYAAYLRAVLPLMRRHGLIIGDDTISMRDEMPEYIELAFSHPELQSVEVPIDDGIIISIKR